MCIKLRKSKKNQKKKPTICDLSKNNFKHDKSIEKKIRSRETKPNIREKPEVFPDIQLFK